MSALKKTFSAAAGVLGALYLLNPTMGVFELLPDALPFVCLCTKRRRCQTRGVQFV